MAFTTEGFFEVAIEGFWDGFEPTATEFRSDALTDWAFKSWAHIYIYKYIHIYIYV